MPKKLQKQAGALEQLRLTAEIGKMPNLFKTLTAPVRLTLRSQEIAFTLASYGVAGSLGSLGIEFGKRGLTKTNLVKSANTPFDSVFGKNLAATFVKLGPTFIKLGQMLATRPDVVGEAVAEELKSLFDSVPPRSFGEIKKTLEKELGKKTLKKEFKEIEKNPLGSASIGQTHKATLKNGTPVILKIQKEGVKDLIETDLLLLSGIAHSLNLIYSRFGILQMYRDFEEATRREIDYREEAKNIERFQKNYSGIFSTQNVIFPKYYPNLSTERVLTMQPMQGKKVKELRKGSAEAKRAAEVSLFAILEQIFDHGFFHADPHGGNMFFLEDGGKVAFIDLGMVGTLKPEDKKRFLKVVMAILRRDRNRLSQALFELGEHSKDVNFQKFDETVQSILDEVKSKGVSNVRFDKLLNKLLAAGRRNGIFVPNRYVLMLRSCLMIEGVAKGLDPGLSIVNVALPVVTRSLIKAYNPLKWFGRK